MVRSMFSTGGLLIRTEEICSRWRKAIMGTEELWYAVVKNYNIPKNNSLVVDLNNCERGTAQYTNAARALAPECRKKYK